MRRYMRKRMGKNMTVSCIAFVLIISILMGRMIFTSMAEEEADSVSYYKSIEIQEGDNLWNIAGRYREGSDMSTSEYVSALRQINHLKEDTIHTGQYLTIVYFE